MDQTLNHIETRNMGEDIVELSANPTNHISVDIFKRAYFFRKEF